MSLNEQEKLQIFSLNISDLEKDANLKKELSNKPLPESIQMQLKKRSLIARSIFAAVELVGALLDIWWFVTSVAALTLALSIFFAVAVICAGIAYAIHAYQDRTKDNQKITESYKLSLLKLDTYNQLKKPEPCNTSATRDAALAAYQPSKVRLIGIVVLTSSLIFISYFYGINSILQSMGFTSLASTMIGPAGIAIALGIALVSSMYFAYKYYQDKKAVHCIRAAQQLLDDQIRVPLFIEVKQKPTEDTPSAREESARDPRFFTTPEHPSKTQPLETIAPGLG